ncbi:MAG: glycosyltransferase family 1 protein [Symploca sp. SIO3E6]|nr:glycosyltransferase family 1 protein [Caldora sp. SIO3E6]
MVNLKSDAIEPKQLTPLKYPVYFVCKDIEKWPELINCDRLPSSLESLFDRCTEGVHVWSVQPYIYLKQHGLDVHLVPRCVPGKICVAPIHYLGLKDLPFNSYVVACRLDSARPEICEQQTVINELCLIKSTDHFLPQWVQPNLKPRDQSRGSKLENLVFKGSLNNLFEPFRSPEFMERLQSLGIRLTCTPQAPKEVQIKDWSDYTQADALIAVRNLTKYDYTVKPAAKLLNAWSAGCPAILGEEPAYQALRKSELDYIEVRSPDEVIAALSRLKNNPELYLAMVENGLKRAQEFTPYQISLLWRNLLAGSVTEGYEKWLKQSVVQKLIGRPIQFVQRAIQHKKERKYYLFNRDYDQRMFADSEFC